MKREFVLALAMAASAPACESYYSSATGDGGIASGDGGPTGDDTGAVASDAAPVPHCAAAGTPARGANVPYQEYEAEAGMTNGAVIGPARGSNASDVFQSIAAESSGRTAVKLAGVGQYVSFTTICQANSIVVRYVLPDSSDGSGISATLGVYVNGSRVQSLNLTSHYAWAYGNPQTNPTTNNPGDGFARHFYDEARALLPADVAAGSTISLQQDSGDSAPYYVIDLVDLEEVAPALEQPPNSVSVTQCGATPDDGTDDGPAIQRCILAAESASSVVWVPPGEFDDPSTPLLVNDVTIHGAGMWRSTLRGAQAVLNCAAGGCQFRDFSMFGEVTVRDDLNSVHAMGGPFGPGCRIENVWVEHYTTGPWVGIAGQPPSDGLEVNGCRFRDLFADGINLTDGAKNAVVEQTQIRNTGDDAFASWAVATSPPNSNNVFRFDTAQIPWLANCFAIYGGNDNSIQDSVCTDVVTYNGIFVDQGFQSNAFGGTTTVARDTILRAGGAMYGKTWGSLTISGAQAAAPITGIQVQEVDIEDSTFSGIFVIGPKDPITGLTFDSVTITNPGTYGIQVDPSAMGSANASNVVVNGAASGGLNNQASGWTFNRGSGNSGW